MADEIRIVIAEDHPFFRDGLRHALAADKSLHLVAEAADGLTAFECIQSLRPDIAIVDIGMPKMDGVALLRKVREAGIRVEFIYLTVCDDEEMFEAALDLGVKGYLLKDCTAHEIVRCVEAVSAGRHYVSPFMTSYVIRKALAADQRAPELPALESLTVQEQAVLRRIAEHKSSKDIAREMDIAVRTVETHRFNICKKLGIHGNYGLSRFAAQHRQEL
jgi:DNA-binding NarL/FixJ family response regulator